MPIACSVSPQSCVCPGSRLCWDVQHLMIDRAGRSHPLSGTPVVTTTCTLAPSWRWFLRP